MKTIWKYNLFTTDLQFISMPQGAEILCVQAQFDSPVIWAIVDSKEQNYESRSIAIYGTGNPVPEIKQKYIGTYQILGGSFVGHVFEII